MVRKKLTINKSVLYSATVSISFPTPQLPFLLSLPPPPLPFPPTPPLQAIHDKIMSLGLNQVHTRIKQVESLSTLGGGIVIQVTGDLSVGGKPSRAFVQTFVLAPTSPKVYYVHNSIFRYQVSQVIGHLLCPQLLLHLAVVRYYVSTEGVVVRVSFSPPPPPPPPPPPNPQNHISVLPYSEITAPIPSLTPLTHHSLPNTTDPSFPPSHH